MGLNSLSLRIAFLLVDTFVVMVFFIHFSYTLFFLFFRLNICLAGLLLLALLPPPHFPSHYPICKERG